MTDQPHEDPRFLNALEVCRLGSDDLADPGLAFLAAEMASNPALRDMHDRLQRLDARVSEAFWDVPVPEGVADRIMDRLNLAGNEGAAADQGSPLTERPAASPAVTVPGGRPRISRGWLFAGVGSLAAAAVLVAVVANIQPPVHSKTVMLDLVMDYFEGDANRGAEGELVADVPPPDDYPFSPGILQSEGMRWRRISGFLDRRGVAYDLASAGGGRATLYVVKHPAVGWPPVAPLRPSFSTHNRSTAAWQRGPLLYVLVVEGGPRRYQSFLDLPRGPLT